MCFTYLQYSRGLSFLLLADQQLFYTKLHESAPEVENTSIFASSAYPRTVGSGPKVENQMIFALSVHPRTVE